MNINELNWTGKERGGKALIDGLRIHYNATNKSIRLTINIERAKAITDNGHFMFAVAGDVIYFTRANKYNGYKFTPLGNGFSAQCVMTYPKAVNQLVDFEGDYNFRFDTQYKLYYVKKGEQV